MAWTSPKIFVDGAILTADDLNIYARDNLLQQAPAKAYNVGGYFVSTGQNQIEERTLTTELLEPSENETETLPATLSTTDYQDLDTVGPSVTATTGTTALIFFGANLQAEEDSFFGTSNVQIAVAVTGASHIDPNDSATNQNFSQIKWTSIDKSRGQLTGIQAFDNLNPGENTFTLKYANYGGVGYFSKRTITVMPL